MTGAGLAWTPLALGRQDVLLAFAVVATLATIALLVTTLRVEVASRRGGSRAPERRRPPSGVVRDPREALALVGDTLAATHNPSALLPVILRATSEATGAAAGRLLEDGEELAWVGTVPTDVEPLRFPIGQSVEGRELTLLLYPPEQGFDEEEERLAGWLASQAAIALENARLHHVVKHQAVTDELTGLVNRRRFIEALESEIGRVRRLGSPLALILADLDDFKLVNDRLGHPVGDELLQAFAGALRDHLRDVDVPARLGGEEFAVLLPETTQDGAVAVAERLQRFLASEPLVVHRGEGLIATASFGVADFAGSESSEDLFRRADAALYQAKTRGKNCVVAADPSPA